MTRILASAFTVSTDGFGAGPGQTEAAPMGEGSERLHDWFRATATFRAMIGAGGGTSGTVDDGFAVRAMENLGAWIMGRNMFGPVRGPWPNLDWTGWWGDVPPYHCDVFVLTHHAREPLMMEGGTTFHFVTGGLDEAVPLARAAAGDRDIRIGGGVATLRDAFARRLIDAAHVAVSPLVMGRGEALWQGLDLPALGYAVARFTAGEGALHLEIERAG